MRSFREGLVAVFLFGTVLIVDAVILVIAAFFIGVIAAVALRNGPGVRTYELRALGAPLMAFGVFAVRLDVAAFVLGGGHNGPRGTSYDPNRWVSQTFGVWH